MMQVYLLSHIARMTLVQVHLQGYVLVRFGKNSISSMAQKLHSKS